jgi:hypothetical protein
MRRAGQPWGSTGFGRVMLVDWSPMLGPTIKPAHNGTVAWQCTALSRQAEVVPLST